MLYRRRVIPEKLVELWGLTARLAEALARKESCDCAWCGAKLRIRRLAAVVLDLYPAGNTSASARSVRAWTRLPEASALRVAEINELDGLHHELQRLPGHFYSEYIRGSPPGAIVDGVRHEDLGSLSYHDQSFDLVLTSETLEHVPDLPAALAEIRRVLAPGGRHIFTVPVLPGVRKSFARSVCGPGGMSAGAGPALFHPGGDAGYPVFTEFGADLPEILAGAGFEVAVSFGPPTESDLAQVYVTQRT
jgi:SAM-dependent methyltransferase